MKSRAGRAYVISVALPTAPPPRTGYPIFYVLDPDTAFATLADAVRNQEWLFGPVVVVGVGYEAGTENTNRIFDLTLPTKRSTLPPTVSPGWGAIGGADSFLDFMQSQLKPRIESEIPIDRCRQALFGHSLGGLFVLHVLFTRPDAFDTYVAGSPSIWWGERVILGELPAFESHQVRNGTPRRLLITVGGLETALTPEELRAELAMKLPDAASEFRKFRMVGNARELASKLRPLSAHGLQTTLTIFPDETHNSVIPAYLGRGARFTLLGWMHSDRRHGAGSAVRCAAGRR